MTGTPQGGTVSPILANVFLHYVLDLWFEKVVKRHCRGEACLIRYADDFVCAFEDQADAERFYNVLGQRLEKFGLELSAAKTRIIPFSRHRQAGKTQLRVSGVRVSLGQGPQGERSPQAPDRAQETPELAEALHRVVQGEPPPTGCQYCSSGSTPNSVGITITTESTGTPPACKSSSTKPCGFC